jgi:hypothetical protein
MALSPKEMYCAGKLVILIPVDITWQYLTDLTRFVSSTVIEFGYRFGFLNIVPVVFARFGMIIAMQGK